jgi:hypothetical protein
MEGYSGAAATFSQEANIAPLQSQNMIEERQAVHHHILRGEIDQAILALNRIDTQVSPYRAGPSPYERRNFL